MAWDDDKNSHFKIRFFFNLKFLKLIQAGVGILLCLCRCDIQGPSASNSGESIVGKKGFSHTGIVTNCSSCHSANKAFPAWPNFGHVDVSNHDCSRCHSVSSWKENANPHFSKTDVQDCIHCHLNKMPIGFVGTASMGEKYTPVGGLYNHFESKNESECSKCHIANPEVKSLSWREGSYSHSPLPMNCMGCHTSDQRPNGPEAKNLNHALFSRGREDCFVCHAYSGANLGRTWKLNKYSHEGTLNECSSCHGSDKDFMAIRRIAINQMNHQAIKLPDCLNCHSQAGKSEPYVWWRVENVANGQNQDLPKLGVFHRNIGKQPSTCRGCHLAERPVAPVGPKSFDHNKYASGDCVRCHTGHPEHIGRTWKH